MPQVGQENPELNKLCELTCDIRHKEECAKFKNTLDPNKILPGKELSPPLVRLGTIC